MRWAIAPIIGTGVEGDPYRLKIGEYGPHRAIIPSGSDGAPLFGWGLGRIDEAFADVANADPQITVFPVFSLDHVLTAAQRNWLVTRLTNHGLPSGWVDPGITVREVLRTIGRWLDNRFDIDWLGVR